MICASIYFGIELQHFAMMIDSIVAIAQGGEMAPLNSLFKRRFQSFSVGEEIERFDVLRFLFEFCFGQPFRFAREVAKLSHDLRIDFIVAV